MSPATAETSVISELAARLADAERSRTPITPLSETHPDLTVEDAYAIQDVNSQARVKAGATIVGHKIGLTSLPMQEMLGVDEPDYGALYGDRVFSTGTEVRVNSLIAPRIEPEIAFILGTDLDGEDPTIDDVLAATEFVAPSLEVIDSRITDWKIKLVDTVADNASCASVVLGREWNAPAGIDLAALEVQFMVDGKVVDTGTGDAVLGHPAEAVVWLAKELHRFGVTLKKGEVVMSGSITAAIPVEPGQEITAHFGEFGTSKALIR